jgi:glycosyltransferase involved in cell wall biosynthesis
MSIGTFMLVKNENHWIAAHILRILPFVDEMVFFDGNSTDGTLEIIEAIQQNEKQGYKIKLSTDKDPKDLQDDYVRLFDQAMWSLSTDLAWFLHPDMYLQNPEQILKIRNSDAVAMSCKMRSFAGEPNGPLLEIKGRGEAWKNIYRLRNPDLGAHYFGHYGAHNEDIYFSEITGDQHEHFGSQFNLYPYAVADSGLEVLHYSDVRNYARRYSRMVACLENQGHSKQMAISIADVHPRVTLKSGDGFDFLAAEYPKEFIEANQKYAHLRKEKVLV